MNSKTLNNAIAEAKRFLERAKELKSKYPDKENNYGYYGCKESGAVKRASMDLTRALAELRK